MAIMTEIDSVNTRFAAVEDALRASLSGRAHKDSLAHFDAHTNDDLLKGVVMLVAGGEAKYNTSVGMEARAGTQRLVIVGLLMVTTSQDSRAVQVKEFALMEEIKAFVKSGVAGVGLKLEGIEQSRQLEHPYGWVTAYLNAGPTKASLS